MKPEQERCDHTEIAAAAADGPEQIRVFLLARRDEASVAEYHIGFEQVVDGQSAAARQVTDASAQRQPADSGSRDDPACGRHAEGVGAMVDLTPDAAAGDADRASGRIDPDSLHVREVDNDAVVADAEPGTVVTATANREQHVVLASEVDRGDDVSDIGAL